MKKLLVLIAVALLLLSPVVIYTNALNAQKSTEYPVITLKIDPEVIEYMVNNYRVEKNLPRLKHNELLCSSSRDKVVDIAENKYFSHDSPSGVTPWTVIKKYIPNYKTAGENIAYSNTSTEDAFNGWIHSEEHRKNILGDYTDTCISAKTTNNMTINGTNYKDITIAVQHFVKQ